MALIPAAVVGMSGTNVKMTSSTPDTAVKSDDKSQTVINTAVSLCGKDFCDEALKAALIIAESNYLSGTKMKTNRIHYIVGLNRFIILITKYILHTTKRQSIFPAPLAQTEKR